MKSKLPIPVHAEVMNQLPKPHQVLIYDQQVEHVGVLLKGLNTDVEAVAFGADSNEAGTLNDILSRPELERLDIVAHGEPGAVLLGANRLDAVNWASQIPTAPPFREHTLQINFWSCRTGEGDIGMKFIQQVALSTKAEVNASSTPIGHEDLGGNWELDVMARPKPPFQTSALKQFNAVLEISPITAGIDIGDGNKHWNIPYVEGETAIFQLVFNGHHSFTEPTTLNYSYHLETEGADSSDFTDGLSGVAAIDNIWRDHGDGFINLQINSDSIAEAGERFRIVLDTVTIGGVQYDAGGTTSAWVDIVDPRAILNGTPVDDQFSWDGIDNSTFLGGDGYDTITLSGNAVLNDNLGSIERVQLNGNVAQTVTVTDAAYLQNLQGTWTSGSTPTGATQGPFSGITFNGYGVPMLAIDASTLSAGHSINVGDSGGNDTLRGGAGDDKFHINGGNDSVNGGFGSDTVVYHFGSSPLTSLSLLGNADTGWVLTSAGESLLSLTQSGGTIQVVDSRTSAASDSGPLGTDQLTGIEQISLTFRDAENGWSMPAQILVSTSNDTASLSLNVRQNYKLGTEAGEVIYGTTASDLIMAGAGDDTVYGGADGAGPLKGTTEAIYGGAGDDYLDGGVGWNQLYGGAGNDTLTGGNAGGFWFDTLTPDRNIANYGNVSTGLVITFGSSDLAGASAHNQGMVIGDESVGTDTLLIIDRVVGSWANDSYVVYNNWYGSQVKSEFFSNMGALGEYNGFVGGGGDDTITGNGHTSLYFHDALSGVDVNISTGVASGVGIGTDHFTGVFAIQASNFNDTLTGGAGDDYFSPSMGNDLVNGGAGSDTVLYSFESTTEGATVDLSRTSAQLINTVAGLDTLISIENVVGTVLADRFTGSSADNKFTGGLGDDMIDGGDGVDTAIYIGNRDDYLIDKTSAALWKVTDLRGDGPQGIDTLVNMERLAFDDEVFYLPSDINSRHDGSISFAYETDVYSFELTQGSKYTFTLEADGSSLDAKLTLFAPGSVPNGSEVIVVNDDAFLLNENARITYVAEETGVYHMWAMGSGTSVGDYVLSVSDSNVPTPFAFPRGEHLDDIQWIYTPERGTGQEFYLQINTSNNAEAPQWANTSTPSFPSLVNVDTGATTSMYTSAPFIWMGPTLQSHTMANLLPNTEYVYTVASGAIQDKNGLTNDYYESPVFHTTADIDGPNAIAGGVAMEVFDDTGHLVPHRWDLDVASLNTPLVVDGPPDLLWIQFDESVGNPSGGRNVGWSAKHNDVIDGVYLKADGVRVLEFDMNFYDATHPEVNAGWGYAAGSADFVTESGGLLGFSSGDSDSGPGIWLNLQQGVTEWGEDRYDNLAYVNGYTLVEGVVYTLVVDAPIEDIYFNVSDVSQPLFEFSFIISPTAPIDPMTDDVMSLADVVADPGFDPETDELAPQTGPLGFDTLDLSEVVVVGALDLNLGVVLVEVADGTLGDTQVLSYTIGTGFDEYVLDGQGDGVTVFGRAEDSEMVSLVSAGNNYIDLNDATDDEGAVVMSSNASSPAPMVMDLAVTEMDIVNYGASEVGLTVDLRDAKVDAPEVQVSFTAPITPPGPPATPPVTPLAIADDTLVGVEGILGSKAADDIQGNALSNLISGNGGNDILNGDAGNDLLIGGSGRDNLSGGTGMDILVDLAGMDNVMSGGLGNDVFVTGDGLAVAGSLVATAVSVESAQHSSIQDFELAQEFTSLPGRGDLAKDSVVFRVDMNRIDWPVDFLQSNVKDNLHLEIVAVPVVQGVDSTDDRVLRLVFGSGATKILLADITLEGVGATLGTTHQLYAMFLDDTLSADMDQGAITHALGFDFNGDNVLTVRAAVEQQRLGTLLDSRGDDVLLGAQNANVLVAGAGNDLLSGGRGADIYEYHVQQIEALSGPKGHAAGYFGKDVITDWGNRSAADADVLYLEGVDSVEALRFERIQHAKEGADGSLQIHVTQSAGDLTNTGDIVLFNQYSRTQSGYRIENLVLDEADGQRHTYDLGKVGSGKAIGGGDIISMDGQNNAILVGSAKADEFRLNYEGQGALNVYLHGVDGNDRLMFNGHDLYDHASIVEEGANGLKVTMEAGTGGMSGDVMHIFFLDGIAADDYLTQHSAV